MLVDGARTPSLLGNSVASAGLARRSVLPSAPTASMLGTCMSNPNHEPNLSVRCPDEVAEVTGMLRPFAEAA